MHRSIFLKKLIASIAIGKLPVTITKDFRKIYLLQSFVAGFRHYEGMQLLETMKAGDLLELVREPANEHDSCAIALHWQSKKIGFIPASINEMLSYLIDAEALSLFAVITHLEKKSQPWENVAVAVYFVQQVDKDLPAHASHLTKIEAPHYRTLNKKISAEENKLPDLEELFEDTNRVINLEGIPEEQVEAKAYFEKYFKPVSINKPGSFVHVNNDGIYNFMYEISEEINVIHADNGEHYLEFFLV